MQSVRRTTWKRGVGVLPLRRRQALQTRRVTTYNGSPEVAEVWRRTGSICLCWLCTVAHSIFRMSSMKTLVVFSHLRWNFVYQRPQHLLSRLAQRWPVVFIEEPVPNATEDRIEQIAAA